jgi:hypothetical protein
VLISGVLAAASNSDDTTFSIPILVGAAALAGAWILLLTGMAAWRRPPRIRPGPPTQDLPPVPPAVGGLLCNDFELPSELPPATLLDLAARPSWSGSRRNIRSWRVRRDLYDAHSQGDTVTALFTPSLGYVREIGTASS